MSAEPERAGGGLVVALPAEARSIGVRGLRTGECKRWRGGWVAICGMGPLGAMRAAEQLVDRGVVQLASWGVAGALEPDLAPGDIIVPERIAFSFGDDGYLVDAGLGASVAATIEAGMPVRRGVLWSSHAPVATRTDKRTIAERSHALAVDMEAAPVAAVARRAALPFVAVKAICDTVERNVPEGIAHTMQQGDGGISPRMLAGIVLGGPRTWRATGQLAGDFARARRALAAAARLVDPVAVAA